MKFTDIQLNEGIKHIEDLTVSEFLDAVKNLNSYEITEKVDGANLWFGIDDKGFYTSREGKGGKRFYSFDDWGNSFSDTGFKSAHKALDYLTDKVLKSKYKDLLKKNINYMVEILFGKLPNAIPYSSEINQIVLLDNEENDRNNLERLSKLLEDKTIKVTVENVPVTHDGISIIRETQEHEWTMVIVPKVRRDQLKKPEAQIHIEKQISKIEKMLDKMYSVGDKQLSAKDILSVPLNKKPDWLGNQNWKEIKMILKPLQEEIKDKLRSSKLAIKSVLINGLVHNMQSHFGPNTIEGVVLKKDDNLIKVVDRDGFTSINKYNWLVRRDIKNPVDKNSVFQELKLKMSETVGHRTLASTKAKSYIKQFGDSIQEQVSNLSADINFETAKKEWIEFLSDADEKLQTMLYNFKNKEGKYSSIQYSEGIVKRTLETFASTKQIIDDYMKATKEAKNSDDLIVILIADKI